MPKQVDHAERRAHIAEAVLAVVARGGLEEVSVRHVATAAGVSPGMVQHYFRSKDEMMRAALERVGAAVQERLGAAGELPPRDLVRALFLQLLPLDRQRTREARVAVAFLAHAAVHPEAGDELRANARALRAHLGARLLGSTAQADAVATGLLALVDGLGLQVLTGQLAADDAVATLDAWLDLALD
ncbi:TetR/AcrR family transcriptional regulator [Pseudonocardia yuanmonensis]|uniref:TetR/AcrR family transcriptional regulator n=1 Tax=Pseudonocardia yuanmonensis TaxID=1095914 RepID=UPI0031ED8D28